MVLKLVGENLPPRVRLTSDPPEEVSGFVTQKGGCPALSNVLYGERTGSYHVWYLDCYERTYGYRCAWHATSKDGVKWGNCSRLVFPERDYSRGMNHLWAFNVLRENGRYRALCWERYRDRSYYAWAVSFESVDGTVWTSYTPVLKSRRWIGNRDHIGFCPLALFLGPHKAVLFCEEVIHPRGPPPAERTICVAESVDGGAFAYRKTIMTLGTRSLRAFAHWEATGGFWAFGSKDGGIQFSRSADGLSWEPLEALQAQNGSSPRYFFDPVGKKHYLYYYDKALKTLVRRALVVEGE